MPLSHQAQRKTPATGVHVRPPWGSSGWNKSGAMVPKDAKATPPPARPRSALTRREANVPRPSPAKPQAQPRASRAREKENPDGTSAPATPAAPVAPARTPPPFAAPFSEIDAVDPVEPATSARAPACPPTPVGSGGVGQAGTDFSLATPPPSLGRRPAPSPVPDERERNDEEEEGQAVDECLDALCAGSDAEGLETARAREPSPKRVAAPASPTTPSREKTKTVEIKIEAPSPSAAIATPADATAADAGNASGPETPFTASRAAKRSRPDPNDVLQDGGEPAADVEALCAPGGILRALFRSREDDDVGGDDVDRMLEAVAFAKTLAEGAAAELASARTALRATPEARVAKKEALRACLLYTSPSPRDGLLSRMPSSA